MRKFEVTHSENHMLSSDCIYCDILSDCGMSTHKDDDCRFIRVGSASCAKCKYLVYKDPDGIPNGFVTCQSDEYVSLIDERPNIYIKPIINNTIFNGNTLKSIC